MTRLLRPIAVFAFIAPLFLAAGCKQGAGERCQVASDCDDGLNCVLPAGATTEAGGICEAPGTIVQDLSTTMAAGDMAGQPPVVDMSQVVTTD